MKLLINQPVPLRMTHVCFVVRGTSLACIHLMRLNVKHIQQGSKGKLATMDTCLCTSNQELQKPLSFRNKQQCVTIIHTCWIITVVTLCQRQVDVACCSNEDEHLKLDEQNRSFGWFLIKASKAQPGPTARGPTELGLRKRLAFPEAAMRRGPVPVRRYDVDLSRGVPW